MTNKFTTTALLCAVTLLTGVSAQAHIVLPAGGANVDTDYEAAFRVGHACKGAKFTNAVIVELPKEFRFQDAEKRDDWTVTAPSKGAQGGTVRWTANNPAKALSADEKAEFIIRGHLPKTAQTLYFPVQQICDVGRADWTQIPTAQDPKAKLETPAARLEVLPDNTAPIDVRDLWIRAAVTGQSGTGAFMTLNAPQGAKLISASSPAAGVVEIHEMKMEGDVMRMREIPTLNLPARESVKLVPGGFHLMMMDLKQPITAGQRVDLTLTFEDANGKRRTRVESAEIKAGAGAAQSGEHKHH